MKVLLIYGGANNGLRKECIQANRDEKKKLTSIKYLQPDTQFLINTVNQMVKTQRIAACDQIEVIYRHYTDLKDYVYEQAEAHTKLEVEVKQLFQPVSEKDKFKDENSAKRFDQLDFVIIDVHGYDLPWFQKSQQLTKFFYQCKLTNKLTLAASSGMAQLAYYCAMESKELSVINGCEKGGSVSKIKSAVSPDMLDKLVEGYHVFLDSLSGDVFTYDKSKQEWKPIGNTGLHYSRAEATIQGCTVGGAGDSVKKAPVYQVDSTAGLKPAMIMSSNYDVKIDLNKNFVQHWCVAGVAHEFMGENINKWDPHPINIVNIETITKNYQAIADTKRGPQIAEHLNTIALQFPIKMKHKDTVKILQNFINNALSRVANEERVGKLLKDAQEEHRITMTMKKAGIPQPKEDEYQLDDQVLKMPYQDSIYEDMGSARTSEAGDRQSNQNLIHDYMNNDRSKTQHQFYSKTPIQRQKNRQGPTQRDANYNSNSFQSKLTRPYTSQSNDKKHKTFGERSKSSNPRADQNIFTQNYFKNQVDSDMTGRRGDLNANTTVPNTNNRYEFHSEQDDHIDVISEEPRHLVNLNHYSNSIQNLKITNSQNNLRSKSAFGTAKDSLARLSTKPLLNKNNNSSIPKFAKPITVQNNAISHGAISMKDQIKRSSSNATFQQENAYSSLGKAQRINFAPRQASDSEDSSRFASVEVAGGADNKAFVDMQNLRKQIPQNIQNDIVFRNIKSVERISTVNRHIISVNKEKDRLLPAGSSEAVKAPRPTHSYNKILQSFNSAAIRTHQVTPDKGKSLRRQSSYYKVFTNISERKEAFEASQASLALDKSKMERSFQKSKLSDHLQGYKSNFQMEKDQRIHNVSELLNYKNKMKIEKQNLDFQAQMEQDTKASLQTREFMNQLIIDTQGIKERVPEIEPVVDYVDDDDSANLQPLLSSTQEQKFELGKSFSSVNVTTKNGYLFSKRVRPMKPMASAYMTKRDDFANSSDEDGTQRTYQSSIYAKPTIKVQVPKQFNRYKYFQSLPKYSMEQPSINIASKYVGKEDEVYRLQDLEKKKSWLTKGGFQKYPGAPGKQTFKDSYYVSADPSKPPMLHQFRDQDRETYIFGDFKTSV